MANEFDQKPPNNNQDRPSTTEGMPEIGEKKEKNPIVLVLLGIILLVFIVIMYFQHRTSKTTDKVLEETYSVQDANQNTSKTNAPNSPVQISTDQATPKLTTQQLALYAAKQKALQERLSAPMMVYNGDNKKNMSAVPASGVNTGDANTQFMNQVSAQAPDTVQATIIAPLNYLIAEGNFIHAVLEPAMNSDLPGMLRAIVDKPVYSEDGSQVLVPPGSRLIGQYKSGLLQGQSRVFVVWTRLIIPGGISINLGSPGTDNLGMAGMNADAIDHHFWQQFGTAILLSIIGTGASNVGVSSSDQYNASQAYRVAMANSLSQTANQSLQQTGAIPPTLWIWQGRPINVFVAHDLNFESAMKQAKRKVNVF